MRKLFFLLASALVLLASSCKKDETPVSVQTLSGGYKLSKMAVLGGYNGSGPEIEFPLSVYLDDCEKDNIRTLNADLSYVEVDAGVSCGFGNHQGTWSLTNSTTIVIDGDTYKIKKFDGKTLKLSIDRTPAGDDQTIYFYLVKQ